MKKLIKYNDGTVLLVGNTYTELSTNPVVSTVDVTDWTDEEIEAKRQELLDA